MMSSVTVITPVAPYHADKVARAIESVQAQTVACVHIVEHDTHGRGAGATRNHALKRVNTPYTVFLDADDWIAPTFTERTLATIQDRSYVYTSWWGKDGVITPEPACWCGDGSWHVITTLLPTEAVRAVGGFDETMPGGEDSDFYWKLVRSGYRGIHLDEPLFHYGDGGKRSQSFVDRDDYQQIMDEMMRRYRGRMAWGCNGMQNKLPPVNTEFEGAVLCIANWQGNRAVRGRVTGRTYPRVGNHRQIWVNRDDMVASNGDFIPLPQAKKKARLNDLGAYLFRNPSPVVHYQPMTKAPAQSTPNVAEILRLYNESVV